MINFYSSPGDGSICGTKVGFYLPLKLPKCANIAVPELVINSLNFCWTIYVLLDEQLGGQQKCGASK